MEVVGGDALVAGSVVVGDGRNEIISGTSKHQYGFTSTWKFNNGL